MSSVNRSRVAIMVAVGMIAMVLGTAVLAQARTTNLVFVPPQPDLPFPNGVTGRCADTSDPIDAATCEIEQLGGPPAGLICDIPVTLFVVGSPEFEAFLCRTQEEAEQQQQLLDPAPVTQEGEQEAESSNVDQSFEVTSTGDNSNQCAGVQGVANTGNPQNVADLLQAIADADDFEFEEVGSDVTVSPESSTTCEQQVNQAASASG